MKYYNPEYCHNYIMENIKPAMEFKPENNFPEWKKNVSKKLNELIGDMPEKVDPNLRIEYENETDLYYEKRFVFSSEAYCDVPCHLLIPKAGKTPFPVIICLQGHSTGMHISLGRVKYENDSKSIKGDRDFAIQAVKEGYAALVPEQRCFGERKHSKPDHVHRCVHCTSVALLLGRTMMGERVWDVSRAIDQLDNFPEIDSSRIGCMGNSGGGTITYFAACLDERISVAMPSCYVCTFKDSIGKIYHCTDNYIPGILKYFEMGDLSCLIAPRPIVVVAGLNDPIFPVNAVKQTFNKISSIYKHCGASDKCKLIIGNEGHRFYSKQAWPVFNKLSGWKRNR